MPSFEEILSMPASEFKPPIPYPVGTYRCIVDGPPEPGKSAQKQTDFLRFKLKIIGIGDDVDAQQAAEMQVIGKTINHDLYVTDGATYRLSEFLAEHLGAGDADLPLKQLISYAPNRECLVKIRHEASQDGKRVFARVASTAHV